MPIPVLLLAFACAGAQAEYHMGFYTLGVRVQKTVNLYFENGLELGYTHPSFWARRVQFKAGWISSRIGSALASNAIEQDYFSLGGALHLRPVKKIDPLFRLEGGYFRYDVEARVFEVLDNDAFYAAVAAGVQFNVIPDVGGFNFEVGYRPLGRAGTLYPAFFSLGIEYKLFPGLFT